MYLLGTFSFQEQASAQRPRGLTCRGTPLCGPLRGSFWCSHIPALSPARLTQPLICLSNAHGRAKIELDWNYDTVFALVLAELVEACKSSARPSRPSPLDRHVLQAGAKPG
jgi:hypothetical protein